MKNNINWIKNAVLALGISGLYSIILVIIRTPQISDFFSDKSIFKSALIIHVNLSVLVWLLSITCFIWSISSIKTGFENLFSYLAFLGMVVMSISPLYPESFPVMNNYIPMLENIVFVIGLALFGTAILLFSVYTTIGSFKSKINNYGNRIIAIVKFTSSIMFIAVWICFFLSYIELAKLSEIVPLDIEFYYEMLFWSGGHLLQFIYTQIFMLSLLIFVEIWINQNVKYSNIYEMLFSLNFVLSLALLVGHYKYDLADGSFKESFTLHMVYTGGLVPIIFIFTLLVELLFSKKINVPAFVKLSFCGSLLLFLFGGAIGARISGANVTIPAHYHGSIVGISVAFMCIVYIVLFLKSFLSEIDISCHLTQKIPLIKSNNKPKKIINWPIALVVVGQMIHISGLALAGGYGVLRKDVNGEITLSAKLYMGMLGIGGLIAIIGGLMFVYICARSLYLKLN